MDIHLELGEVWEFKQRYQDIWTFLGIITAFEEEEELVYLISKTEVREQYEYYHYQLHYHHLIRRVEKLSIEEMLTHSVSCIRRVGGVLLEENRRSLTN